MSETIGKIQTWEKVIIEFFEKNIADSNLYKARKYINEKKKEIDLEKNESVKEKLIAKRNEKINDLEKYRIEAKTSEIPKWLDENCSKTGSIKKATHVLRFTHSSSNADGLLLKDNSEYDSLTTSSLQHKVHDMAHNNGALISISRFLAVVLNETSIFDEIVIGKYDFLEAFSNRNDQIISWGDGFKKLVVSGHNIKAADKAKQIFFPLNIKNKLDASGSIDCKNYHLLVPLFSSSLAEEFYSRQANINFGEEQVSVRKAKKITNAIQNTSPHYHRNIFVDLPNLAVQKFGGSQSQNVSMLNKSRSWKADKKDKNSWGVTYLFNSAPPTWQSLFQPPLYKKSLFDVFYHPSIKQEVDYLRDYLLRFERIELSIKNPQRLQWIEKWVINIIDELLNFAASIHILPAGWSGKEECKLKPDHQYFLDPYRDEEKFQNLRKGRDWQSVICSDFSRWLNRLLAGRDKKFTPQSEHTRLWTLLLEKPLREYIEVIETGSKSKQLKENK